MNRLIVYAVQNLDNLGFLSRSGRTCTTFLDKVLKLLEISIDEAGAIMAIPKLMNI